MTWIFRGALLLWFHCVAPLAAAAEDVAAFRTQVWLNPGAFSYHFDRSQNFRENNFGIGAEVATGPDSTWMFASFINSERSRSRFAGWQWRPLHGQFVGMQVHAGIVAAAFDGYPRMRDGGWFLSLLPVVALEGDRLGLNLSVVPTIEDRLNGAILFQVKFRVW
ncbi:MAG: hypothetical protein ACKVP2_14900 [Burkholderiales bacterium]